MNECDYNLLLRQNFSAIVMNLAYTNFRIVVVVCVVCVMCVVRVWVGVSFDFIIYSIFNSYLLLFLLLGDVKQMSKIEYVSRKWIR